MNYQKRPPQHILDKLDVLGINYLNTDYYAWPQLFGSTAGPHTDAIGGAAMSTFTVEAWSSEKGTLYYCADAVKFVEGKFEPFVNVFE